MERPSGCSPGFFRGETQAGAADFLRGSEARNRWLELLCRSCRRVGNHRRVKMASVADGRPVTGLRAGDGRLGWESSSEVSLNRRHRSFFGSADAWQRDLRVSTPWPCSLKDGLPTPFQSPVPSEPCGGGLSACCRERQGLRPQKPFRRAVPTTGVRFFREPMVQWPPTRLARSGTAPWNRKNPAACRTRAG